MKRAALYCRVSTVDQHPETQLGDPSGETRCGSELFKTLTLWVTTKPILKVD